MLSPERGQNKLNQTDPLPAAQGGGLAEPLFASMGLMAPLESEPRILEKIEPMETIHPPSQRPEPQEPPRWLVMTLSGFVVLVLFLAPRLFFVERDNRSLRSRAEAVELALQMAKEENTQILEKAEQDRLALTTALEEAKKDVASWRERAEKAEKNFGSVRDEKTYLEDILIRKTKLIEDLEKRAAQAVDLGKIRVEDSQPEAAASASTTSPVAAATTRAPKTEGRVLAINDAHGFVVIDLGRVDHVKPDSKFVVKKNGKAVATLSVIEIRDVMTACNVKTSEPGTKVAMNDPVSFGA